MARKSKSGGSDERPDGNRPAAKSDTSPSAAKPEPERRQIGYARVSTDDQDLSLQLDALRRAGCTHIYEDKKSGGTMNRRGLSYVLRTMREGDTVYVWKLDRLGRTLTGVIATVEDMRRQGIQLVSLTEKIDTTSAMGRAFFQIALVFAELERALISERTAAGIAVARAAGKEFGAKHSITSDPKRLAEAKRILEEFGPDGITGKDALARLNAANPKLKPIKTPVTWGRWIKAGAPGADD